MAFLEWSDKYIVGISTFDNQHKRLAGYINELHDAMLAGKGSVALGEILQGLIEYTKTHFKAEEELMSHHGYDKLDAHKDEHEELTQQVLDFQHQFKSGEAVLSVPIMQFLKEWLTHHIMETDKDYGPFLRECGVV
jgi:hemerythrin-like metal-binding protein